MATVEQLINTVVQASGRPDQMAWALTSLNSCLKEMCRTGDYAGDLYEHYWQPDPDGNKLQGPLKIIMPSPEDFTEPPNYTAIVRKIAYLSYDNTKLTEVSPQHLLLSGCQEQDVFYRNGLDYLMMNTSFAFDTLKIGVYVCPIFQDLTDTSYHWLLDEAEEILILGVMAKVYKNTGDDASHDRYYAEYNLQKRQFKLDHVGDGVS